jgi:hypothetical protein
MVKTWYNHAAQRNLEAKMSLEEHESQQVQRKRRRRNPENEGTGHRGGSGNTSGLILSL